MLLAGILGSVLGGPVQRPLHQTSGTSPTALATRDHDAVPFRYVRAPAKRARRPAPQRASRSTRAPRPARTSTAPRRTAPRRVATVTVTTAASRFLGWINDARSARSLSWNSTLASYARSHSANMAERGSLYHSSGSQLQSNMRRSCSSCSTVGEIVGSGATTRQVFDAFLKSSYHRSLIMDGSFRMAGVGIVYARGAYWITVQFAG